MTDMQFNTLNWVDFLILAVIGISILISFMRGFIKEIVSILIWCAAVLLAFLYAGKLASRFTEISSQQIRYILSFIAIFICVLIAGVIINALTGVLVSKSGISVVDRFLGIFFGAARGALLVAVTIMLLHFGGFSFKAVGESQLVPKFLPLVSWLDKYVPEKLDAITDNEKFDNLNQNQSSGSINNSNESINNS
jgi:membrane protein required for colicin V production